MAKKKGLSRKPARRNSSRLSGSPIQHAGEAENNFVDAKAEARNSAKYAKNKACSAALHSFSLAMMGLGKGYANERWIANKTHERRAERVAKREAAGKAIEAAAQAIESSCFVKR